MNKKTILFLINGFGVEKKESYSIYDATLMPTFDTLSKKYLFGTIESNVSNYYDAYRNISLDIKELYNYTLLDQDIVLNKKFLTNQVFLDLKKNFDTKKSNLHIFCLVDTSIKIVNHLKEHLKTLNPNKDKKITLHLILSSTNIHDYKALTNVLSKINMDLAEYAKIGFVLGLSSIGNEAKQVDLNFFFRMFISKVGEKWKSFTQKFDVMYGTKVLPRDVKPFLINSDFTLEKDDIFLFYNYDNINLINFIDTLSAITYGAETNNFTYYSLFPVVSNKKVINMYQTSIANNSLIINLEKIKATGLILCQKEQVSIINYYCNGLKNEGSKTLSFVDIAPYEKNPQALVEIINQFTNDLIIINYEIDNYTKIKDLKDKLKEIDNSIKAIYDNMLGSRYTLIISSLYGISKVMLTEKENICQVIFAGKVPFIFVDDFITKKDYLIQEGCINDIFKTIYKNIKRDSDYKSIVIKKNGLYKLFFK